ncbi:hypothetical protein ACTFIV_007891 [Dictyostelium citrinum]
MNSSSDQDKKQNVEEPGQSNVGEPNQQQHQHQHQQHQHQQHNSNNIQIIFDPNNNFISSNHNQNDNNSHRPKLEITTTPITEIISRQPPTQTLGIGNYVRYHYIEPPLGAILPPHPPVGHPPTNGSTTTATIPTIASITAPKPVTRNAARNVSPDLR